MENFQPGASGSNPASGGKFPPNLRLRPTKPLVKTDPVMKSGNGMLSRDLLPRSRFPVPDQTRVLWDGTRSSRLYNGRDMLEWRYLSRNVGEVLVCWLLEQCKVTPTGGYGRYLEEYFPWDVACQLWRTMHPGRPNGFDARISNFEPDCGILIYRIDYEIWTWFANESAGPALVWHKPGEEPLEYHENNDWMEIPSITLHSGRSAWRQFGDRYLKGYARLLIEHRLLMLTSD